MRIDSARYLLSAIARADGCKRGFAPVKGRGCQRAKLAQEGAPVQNKSFQEGAPVQNRSPQEGAPVQEQPRRKKEGLMKKLMKPKNIFLANAGLVAAYGVANVVGQAIHQRGQDKEVLGRLEEFSREAADVFHTESPEARLEAIRLLEGIAKAAKANNAPRSKKMAEELLVEYRKKDREALAAEEEKRQAKEAKARAKANPPAGAPTASAAPPTSTP